MLIKKDKTTHKTKQYKFTISTFFNTKIIKLIKLTDLKLIFI